MDSLFHFKHFSLKNIESSMKIGTDAILLGAWLSAPQIVPTSAEHKHIRMLDIGTGTGVISLITAQRFIKARGHNFNIDAIDIDLASANEAQYNFALSPWAKNLQAHHKSLSDFLKELETNENIDWKYDLIFSNPPYFQSSLKNPNVRKTMARHCDDSLSHEEIIYSAAKLLAPKGRIALILPLTEGEIFKTKILREADFNLHRICRIKTSTRKAVSRLLMEFSFQDKEAISSAESFSTSELIINEGEFHSSDYIELLSDICLKKFLKSP